MLKGKMRMLLSFVFNIQQKYFKNVIGFHRDFVQMSKQMTLPIKNEQIIDMYIYEL